MDPECLRLQFWSSVKTQYELNQRFNSVLTDLERTNSSDRQTMLELFGFLVLYIRDRKTGMGKRDLSRWLLLALERSYPSLTHTLVARLPQFGYWKDTQSKVVWRHFLQWH